MGNREPDDERLTLTEQQQAVVDADGNFLFLACPGSGKTRAGAERVARLVRERTAKVAVCSYTNVGAERIGSVLATDLGVVLDHEHFLGTLHRFLLRYVVHPYAHLVGAKRGPFIHEGAWPDVRVHGDTPNAFRSTSSATPPTALSPSRRTPAASRVRPRRSWTPCAKR